MARYLSEKFISDDDFEDFNNDSEVHEFCKGKEFVQISIHLGYFAKVVIYSAAEIKFFYTSFRALPHIGSNWHLSAGTDEEKYMNNFANRVYRMAMINYADTPSSFWN